MGRVLAQARRWRVGQWLGYGALFYLGALMLQITAQYGALRTDVAFLRVKTAALAFPYYRYVFFAHVFTSMAVLVLGGVQLSPKLRTAAPALHRVVGRAYVGLILVVAAPSGLVMAAHANGGWTAQLSFVLQAVLWWWFTYRGVVEASAGNVDAHRRYMILSYALTLSALSLRLWKWGLVAAFAPAPMDVYRVVAWLGWVGNLAVAWWWLGLGSRTNRDRFSDTAQASKR